jgi:hypothetical protein
MVTETLNVEFHGGDGKTDPIIKRIISLENSVNESRVKINELYKKLTEEKEKNHDYSKKLNKERWKIIELETVVHEQREKIKHFEKHSASEENITKLEQHMDDNNDKVKSIEKRVTQIMVLDDQTKLSKRQDKIITEMYEMKRIHKKYAGVIDMFHNDAFLDRQRIMILENDMIFTKQEIDKHYYNNPNKRKIVYLDKIYGDNQVDTKPKKMKESLLLVKKTLVQPSLILIPNQSNETAMPNQPTVTLIPNQSMDILIPNQPIV